MKPDNMWLLLAAGGGSIAMHNSGADSKVAKNFANRGNLNRDVDKIGDYMGGPGQHFAAAYAADHGLVSALANTRGEVERRIRFRHLS